MHRTNDRASEALNKKILVVDDSPDDRTIFGSLLSHFGFDVIVAEDGLDGVRVAQAEKPALILMDIMMPIMSGFSATRMLREMRDLADTPVVGISHYDPTPEELARSGFTEFVHKTFEPESLLSIVRRHLDLGSEALALDSGPPIPA